MELTGIDAAVDALFARSTASFADVIARTLDPTHTEGATPPLVRTGAMHGLLAIAREWVAGDCVVALDIVIDAA